MDKQQKEQARVDGQEMKKDSEAEGHIGIKTIIADQVMKQLEAQGKLLLHWRYQFHSKVKYPAIFPVWLAGALQTDVEKVCEVLCKMVVDKKIVMRGNIPQPIIASVLVEHCKTWEAVNANPQGSAGRGVDAKVTIYPNTLEAVGAFAKNENWQNLLL